MKTSHIDTNSHARRQARASARPRAADQLREWCARGIRVELIVGPDVLQLSPPPGMPAPLYARRMESLVIAHVRRHQRRLRRQGWVVLAETPTARRHQCAEEGWEVWCRAPSLEEGVQLLTERLEQPAAYFSRAARRYLAGLLREVAERSSPGARETAA